MASSSSSSLNTNINDIHEDITRNNMITNNNNSNNNSNNNNNNITSSSSSSFVTTKMMTSLLGECGCISDNNGSDAAAAATVENDMEQITWRIPPQLSLSDWTIEVKDDDGSWTGHSLSTPSSSLCIHSNDHTSTRGDIYHVHRAFLAIGSRASLYFRALFMSWTKDSTTVDTVESKECMHRHSVVYVPPQCREVFPLALDYMYGLPGAIEPTVQTAVPLLRLSDQLQMTFLSMHVLKCVELMCSFHDAPVMLANALELLDNDSRVVHLMTGIIACSFIEYQRGTFNIFPVTAIVAILKHDSLVASPAEVSECAMDYLRYHTGEVQSKEIYRPNDDKDPLNYSLTMEEFELLCSCMKNIESDASVWLLALAHRMNSDYVIDRCISVIAENFDLIGSRLRFNDLDESMNLLSASDNEAIPAITCDNFSANNVDVFLNASEHENNEDVASICNNKEDDDDEGVKLFNSKIPIVILPRLLSHDDLAVNSEDTVFYCISSCIHAHLNTLSDDRVRELWNCCRFPFLSVDCMIKALSDATIPQHFISEGCVAYRILSSSFAIATKQESYDAFCKLRAQQVGDVTRLRPRSLWTPFGLQILVRCPCASGEVKSMRELETRLAQDQVLGWGYDGRAKDIVLVRVSKAIYLFGVGVAGGTSPPYVGSISVLHDDQVLICVDFEVTSSSGIETVLFSQPVYLAPDVSYSLVQHVSSRNSKGAFWERLRETVEVPTGQGSETVKFSFYDSSRSNNGTTSIRGQMPALFWWPYNVTVP